jgi:hypothetical protein
VQAMVVAKVRPFTFGLREKSAGGEQAKKEPHPLIVSG